MQRVTISLDDGLAVTLDAHLKTSGYTSRSEGVRDIVRAAVERRRSERLESVNSVGTLSYIYDRSVRSLAERLSRINHAHHDLVLTVTQAPLDHIFSLVSVILSGKTAQVRRFADEVLAERGVSFGSLNVTSVELGEHHHHPDDHSHPGHAHRSPAILTTGVPTDG